MDNLEYLSYCAKNLGALAKIREQYEQEHNDREIRWTSSMPTQENNNNNNDNK